MVDRKWADLTPTVPFGGLHGSGNDKTQFERIVELERDLAAAQEALRFVERWANHHGVKPCVKPEHALSTIQHYPPILAITRSYADGKVPETRNPWAELKEAQEALNQMGAAMREARTERDEIVEEK